MATDLTIRVANQADLDALGRLAIAFRDHLERATPTNEDFRKGIAVLLEDRDTEFLLASDARGAHIGYLQARYRRSAWTRGFQGEIEDVFVVPEARRRGVGRRLLERAIARAAERGCRLLGLTTNERNTAALALYLRLGFVVEPPLWHGGRQLWLEKVLDTH